MFNEHNYGVPLSIAVIFTAPRGVPLLSLYPFRRRSFVRLLTSHSLLPSSESSSLHARERALDSLNRLRVRREAIQGTLRGRERRPRRAREHTLHPFPTLPSSSTES